MEETNIIAIEIGSSRIKGAYGTYSPTGVLTVKIVEEEPLLDWVRYGAVSNVEETSIIVNRIIRKIESRVAPSTVAAVYVGLGGRSCCSLRKDVERTLPDEREITEEILTALRQEAASIPLTDRDLLAVVPRQYMVDKTVVSRPKGTVGRCVKFSSNLITCRTPSKRNIDILFNDKLQLNIGGYEVRQLAIGDLVINPEEKKLGCMLVDFGAETTTVSIYKKGHLQYLATLPMGSRNITRDITNSNNILEEKAEELKIREGNMTASPASHSSAGLDYTNLQNIIAMRAGEIIANIQNQLTLAGFKNTDLTAGIIIVGRGSLLPGFNQQLSSVTGLKIRCGSISNPDIRISDSRISTTDSADIIAILYKAAMHGADDCLKTETVELTSPEETVVLEPQPETIEIIPEPEDINKKGQKKTPWYKGIKDIMTKLGGEGEDDDDELRDDE